MFGLFHIITYNIVSGLGSRNLNLRFLGALENGPEKERKYRFFGHHGLTQNGAKTPSDIDRNTSAVYPIPPSANTMLRVECATNIIV